MQLSTFSASRQSRICGFVLPTVYILCLSAATAQSASTREGLPPFAWRSVKRPLIFEEKTMNPSSSFLVHGLGFTLALNPSAAVLSLSSNTGTSRSLYSQPVQARTNTADRPQLVQIHVVNAQPQANLTGDRQLPGTVNYLLGNDPAKWETSIPTYARVQYSGVYPGIDLVYYGSEERLEFDFDIASGADPRQIQMDFGATNKLALDKNGNLAIGVGESSILLHKPVIYQQRAAKHQAIPGGFRLLGHHRVGFVVGAYDHTLPLVIDPILTYSTYLGSSSNASANAVAVDAAGNAYVTGWALADFPVTTDAYQSKFTSQESGGTVAFVTKFDPNGNVLYSTYLGGSVQDGGNAIAVDASGNAYIAGYTASPDFPVTSGAFQTTDKVSEQPDLRQFTTFVTKLNSTGSALVYSTFLGGSVSDISQPQTQGQEQATGIGLDAAGNAYVTGFTFSTDFPTTPGGFQISNPGTATQSASFFVTKLNATGSALDYSTYLGGNYYGDPPSIAVDADGSAYIAGGTLASNYPTTPGAFDTTYSASSGMAVVSKLNTTGTGLAYSTYLGGGYEAYARAIAVDSSGSAYVTGAIRNSDFPVTPGTVQVASPNVFVTKINPAGSALTYSATLGKEPGDYGNAIAVDAAGNAYVAGQVGLTSDFSPTPGAFENQVFSDANGVFGSFLAKLNSTATTLDYLTYLSGSGSNPNNVYDCDCILGMALDPSGNPIVVGSTVSADFPTTLAAFDPGSFNEINSIETNYWAFVTKFNGAEMATLPQTNMNVSVNANPQLRETPVVFTAALAPASSGGVPTGSVEFSNDFGILCTSAVDSAGTATCSTTALTLGPEPVRVTYYGDQNDSPATQSVTETIEGIPTTTTITGSATSVVYGSPVTFNAHVAANVGTGVPTAAVIFSVACQNAPENYVALDSNGNANCITASDVPVGTYNVTVGYIGDQNYAQSVSAGVPLTILPLGIAATPTFSPTPGTFNQDVNVTIADSSPNSTIYYTTDGSTPTLLNGNRYSVPIVVTATEMINAIALVPGYTNSPVASATYTLPPNFTLGLTPGTMAITGTQSATTTVTLTSEFSFAGQVNFTCSGLPAGSSCSFSPTSVTGNPQQQVTTTMTVTGSGSAALQPDHSPWEPIASLAVVVSLFGLRKHQRLRSFLLVAYVSVGLLFLAACSGGGGTGGGGGGGGQTPVTSTVTVTGTSGTIQNTATLTVTYTP
jgi:hypothetical protein